jgi:microcystin-dependent protein
VAISQGTGLGLPTYVIGQTSGAESVTLTSAQIGGHTHTLQASSLQGTTVTPTKSTALASNESATYMVFNAGTADVTLAQASIGPSGAGGPHENRQPFVVINYIISLFGVFPSQG